MNQHLKKNLLVVLLKLKSHFSRKNLQSNWTIKLSCFVLSLLLYFNLQNSKILEKEFKIPVVYPSLSKNYTYEKSTEKFVTVRLKGLESNINFYSSFIKAYIKVDNLKNSNDTFKTGVLYIPISHFTEVPNDLKLFTQNKMIKVVIAEKVKKSIPIEVGFVEQMPNTKVKHSISPKRVSVYGVSSELKKVRKITLPNISLKNKTESFNQRVELPSLPGNLTYKDNISRVNVMILITQAENVETDDGQEVVEQVEQAKDGNKSKLISVNLPIECSIQDLNYDISFSKKEVKATLSYSSSMQRDIEELDYVKESVKAKVNCFYLENEANVGPIKSKMAKINLQSKIEEVEILELVPQGIEIFYSEKPSKKQTDFSQELINDDERNSL